MAILKYRNKKGTYSILSDVGGGSSITEDLTVTNAVGNAKKGNEYKAGTAIEDIVVDMLSLYTAPTITITTNLTEEVLDIESSLSDITITTKIKAESRPVNKVTIFIDDVELKSYEGANLHADGTYIISYTFDPAISKTFNIKVTVDDGENTTKMKQITFIGKSYWGSVEGEDIIIPTEADILGLEFNKAKNTKALIYSEIKVEYGKVLYAYPASLGVLSKITDADGRDYTNSYSKSEVNVNGTSYYCYLLKDAMGTSNGYQAFS